VAHARTIGMEDAGNSDVYAAVRRDLCKYFAC
jgi:hypothetical protein